jgi:hypothetical protein
LNEKLVNKPDLIVLGFDNTLYENPSQDYSINIKEYKILPAHYFFQQLAHSVEIFSKFEFAHNTQFFLMTKRPDYQRDIILNILRTKGYKIDKDYFWNYDFFNDPHIRVKFDEKKFKIRYWSEKINKIHSLHQSNKFRSITVIDNSEVICSMLKDLHYTVMKAEIRGYQVFFEPFNQQSNSQLIEREVVAHG